MKKAVARRSANAVALQSNRFAQKVVKSKKLYSRKGLRVNER